MTIYIYLQHKETGKVLYAKIGRDGVVTSDNKPWPSSTKKADALINELYRLGYHDCYKIHGQWHEPTYHLGELT
jgi:hypothetical protein